MEVICAILTALFGIGFGILWRCSRRMPLPYMTVDGIRRPNQRRSTSG